MTREELKELFDESDRIFGKPEDPLTKWKREADEQEARFAREREKSRNLTDSEMARWREYFEGLVASERAAAAELVRDEREFTNDVMAQVVAELRENIEADTQQALDGVRKQGEERLAELRGVVDRLRSDLLALGAQQEDVRARMADVAQSIAGLPAEGPPGPEGPQGPPGPPALFPETRVWSPDAVSYRGDVVTHAGGTWQARKDTGKEPPHPDWIQLAVPGRDGRDGRDAISPTVRGTWRADATYKFLDVVALNRGSFVAKYDNPGPCPGDGWQLLVSAVKGERGQRGDRGPSGPPGPPIAIASWVIDRVSFTATPVMTDGSEGPPLELRGLFEQYQTETG